MSKINKEKQKDKNKSKNWLSILLIIVDVCAIVCFVLFYGPFDFISDRFVTTAMTTASHKYFARVFYSEEYIDTILNRNVTINIEENTDASIIQVSNNADTGVYDSVYDKEILQRDEGNDIYKVIPIEGSSWKGWIVAIYDPSRISVAMASNRKTGKKTSQIAKENDAIIAINGGGFIKKNSMYYPAGAYIQDGKAMYDGKGRGKVIGFNEDHVLMLLNATSKEAVQQGIRDGLFFKPFLVVNGVKATFKGNGGYGNRPRTAIGQREDGIVLFIVIDGKRLGTGISMPDLAELFVRYKAVNAANLDGGGSSTLVINNKLINSPAGWDYRGERWVIDAFIVK